MSNFKSILEKNNRIYKIIAVFLAIILWQYVVNLESSQNDIMLTVPVEVIGLSDQLSIVDIPDNVKVRVRNSYRTDNISAICDLTGLAAGRHDVAINIDSPENVTILSVSPKKINVLLESISKVQMPVSIYYGGTSLSSEYTMVNPSISPAEVVIKGADSNIKKINKIIVNVNLSGVTGNYSKSLPVQVLDRYGKSLNSVLTVSPSSVKVNIPVVSNLPSKNVPINVILKGTSSENVSISAPTSNPSTVTLFGTEEDLKKVSYVETEPIDISAITADMSVSAKLVIDAKFKYYGSKNVTVTLGVEKNSPGIVRTIPVGVVDKSEGLTYSLSESTVMVTISGINNEDISNKNITAYVSVANLLAGEHLVAVNVDLPSGMKLDKVTPNKIKVTVEG